MSIKLLLSVLNGYWAISEEGARNHFPMAQALLRGNQDFKAVELLKDQVLAFDDDGEEMAPPETPDAFVAQIAIMSIIGPLLHYGGACSYGAVDYADRILAYADDESIAAVILDTNCPGGQVEGTETLAAAVKYCASKKPIIAFCEDGVIASAAVWFTSYCTEIWVGNKLCRVGSVGVMASLLDARKAMEINGYQEVIIRAPQSVDKNKDTEDALNGKTEAIEAELSYICAYFLQIVATNFAERLTSEEWNTGKMFFAEDATRIGLINGIKSRSEVIQRTLELATNSNSQNPDNMFGNKFPSLTALAGAPAAGVTAAQVASVNAEIQKLNIAGVTLALDTDLEAAADGYDAAIAGLNTINAFLGEGKHVTGLTAGIAALVKQASDAQAQITALTGERDTYKANAEKYGKQPGAEPTGGQANQETIENTGNANAFFSEADAARQAKRAATVQLPRPLPFRKKR